MVVQRRHGDLGSREEFWQERAPHRAARREAALGQAAEEGVPGGSVTAGPGRQRAGECREKVV